MPLSEHEQQLLEQMEQALYAEDPKFASQMQGAGARAAARRRMAIAVVGVLAGLALIIFGGIRANTLWLGAVGFALMVAAVAFAVTPPRRSKKLGAVQSDGTIRRTTGNPGTKRTKSPKSAGSFMQRLEERWDKRRDQY